MSSNLKRELSSPETRLLPVNKYPFVTSDSDLDIFFASSPSIEPFRPETTSSNSSSYLPQLSNSFNSKMFSDDREMNQSDILDFFCIEVNQIIPNVF